MTYPSLPSTQGRPMREQRAGGFRLMEVRHEPGVRLRAHSHLHPSLCLVLDGGFEERVDSACFEADAASLLVEPAGMPHSSAFGTRPTRSVILEVQCPALARRLDDLGGPLRTPSLQRGPQMLRLGQELATELGQDDPASVLALEGLALELVAAVCRRQREARATTPPPWLTRTAAQLRARFREQLEIDQLARDAEVHPMHLARSFRRHYGESLGGQVRRLRLEWCAERLSCSADSLAAIARQGGFCDQSHLSRHFRRAYGCTPGQYRQLHATR